MSKCSAVKKLRESYTFDEESDADVRLTEPCMLSADMSLEEQLANMGASFHEKLFELIATAGVDNKDVWKKCKP